MIQTDIDNTKINNIASETFKLQIKCNLKEDIKKVKKAN